MGMERERRSHRVEGEAGPSVAVRPHMPQNWRRAATALSAAACAAAVVSFVAADGGWGFRTGRDVLLSAGQQREFRDATALKRIHSSYDRAKGRLARMSTEYTDLGVKLQAAESRAGSLRTELESKMREIRGEFHRGDGAKLAEQQRSNQGVLMSLATVSSRRERTATKLEHEVAELRETVRRVDTKEATQATELQQLRHAVPAVASTADEDETTDIVRFPRRPLVAFRAERTLSKEKLASLGQLNDVNLQLEAENRRICELCAKSAVLRANRQATCIMCSQHAHGVLQGDTGLVEPHLQQQAPTQSLAGEAINVFVSGWKAPSAVQMPQAPVNVGDIVANAALISARNAEVASAAQVPQQQLVQIDDGSHMGTAAMVGPTVTAFVISDDKHFVVGKCAPSENELKYSSWYSMCTMCKAQLGVDIEAMGHKVHCSHNGVLII